MLTDIESQRLDADGYLKLEGIVQSDRIKAMHARLLELHSVTEQKHQGTLIVGGLLQEQVFDAAWLHPRILAAVRQVLGDGFRLTGVSSRGIQPGHGQQALHVDWGGQGTPGVWYGCHVICALVNFTQNNGATRIIPGSHRNPWMLKTRHDARKPHPAQWQLTGKAGSLFVLNIHCGHSAVYNATNQARLAIFTNFSRRDSPLLLANPIPAPNPDVLGRFDTKVRSVLQD